MFSIHLLQNSETLSMNPRGKVRFYALIQVIEFIIDATVDMAILTIETKKRSYCM